MECITRELDLMLSLNDRPGLKGRVRGDAYGAYDTGCSAVHAELQRYERERRRRHKLDALGRR
jgi:hypothetical protein